MALTFKRSWTDEDLERYRDSVARFIESEMLPDDEAARKRGHVGHALWRRAGELGLLCADIPERYGGGGGDFRHEAVFYEEMARRGLTGMSDLGASIVAHYFLNHGTEAQKQRWLPRMARGELRRRDRDDRARRRLRPAGRAHARRAARRRTTSSMARKTFITNGFLAGLVLVVAKTDPAQGARGTSILIVETDGLRGLSRRPRARQDRHEGAGHLRAVLRRRARARRQPARRRGGPGLLPADGRPAVRAPDHRRARRWRRWKAPTRRRSTTCASASAFGKPIAEFQNTRFKLAEVATQIRVGARLHRPLRRATSSPARSTPRPRRWPSCGLRRRRAACSTSCCSCTAATAT